MEWISTSERLPKAEEKVWIQTKRGKVCFAMYEDGTISEDDSAWHWYDLPFEKWDEGNDCGIIPEGWWEWTEFHPDDEFDCPVDEVVVAWMPLPKPYTADRKTENCSENPNNCEKDCFLCKWLGDVDVCGRCRNRNLFAEADTEPKPKDEPKTQTETQNSNLTLTKGVWNAGYKTGYDKGYKDAQKVKDSQDLVKDLVKAFCEDGTWLERQGVYTLTLAEAKQRAVDIIESVLAKDEPQTEEHCENCRHKDECEGATYEYKNTEWWCLAYAPIDEPQTDCAWK